MYGGGGGTTSSEDSVDGPGAPTGITCLLMSSAGSSIIMTCRPKESRRKERERRKSVENQYSVEVGKKVRCT